MYPTMELRWFLPGPPPESIQNWFQSIEGAATNEANREDRYLSLPLATLGIKQRQDAIEIKQRIAKGKVQRLTKGIKGQVEQWVKWSFPLDGQQSQPNLTLPPGTWITIQKSRQLKRYGVLPDGTVTAMADSETAEQSCTLELTNLWLAEQQWYSLGLEASGPEDHLGETLMQVTQAVFSGSDAPLLKGKDSYGYPKWLTRLLKEFKSRLSV
ncbi:MAG: hypothetical protein IGS38_04710 [Synechococcales cyanobacterium M58_A2018_015]|nr:hypothetical protein [Synechococcales cyanobacterium M58_A2018_015]